MWKFVVGLLALGLVGYYFNNKSGSNAPAQAGAAAYEGFLEVRMLMQIQGVQREIEMVAIEERPHASDCETSQVSARITATCPNGRGVSCKVKSIECSREIEPRYSKMLNKQPASVHYAHIEVDEGAAPRRAVLLGWGMTEQESQLLCSAIRTSTAQKTKGTVTCI